MNEAKRLLEEVCRGPGVIEFSYRNYYFFIENNSIDHLTSITFDPPCDVCVQGQDYCSDSWLPKKNLDLALRGIDIGRKLPLPIKPQNDPSRRGMIFNAMHLTEGGAMAKNDLVDSSDELV